MERFRTYFLQIILALLVLPCLCASCTAEKALLNDAQKAYLAMPHTERIGYFENRECRLEMVKAGYYPQPVTFQLKPGTVKWVLTEAGAEPEKTVPQTNNSMIPKYVRAIQQDDMIQFENLKIAAKYTLTFFDKAHLFYETTFVTEDQAPRLLRIDGVPNVRDLGGRPGLNGRRVKQGMVYRTAGLNDNAGRKLIPEETLRKDPAIQKFAEKHEAILSSLLAKQKSGVKDVPVLPYALSNEWIMFHSGKTHFSEADRNQFAKLTAIPAELLNGKGEKIKTDAEYIYVLPGQIPYRQSVFMQEFESPADGLMQIGVCSDWFYAVYVNGKTVRDCLDGGSAKHPPAADNEIVNIPVKKGKNLIVIPVLSGGASWIFCCGKPSKYVPASEILQQEINAEKRALASKLVAYMDIPGANRLNDEMKTYIKQDLGVKIDLDLRSELECLGMTGSPAGEPVKWIMIPFSSYGGMQGETGKNAFKKAFRLFLNEDNYPLLFHCIAGQDRTGSLAFILNALLGVDEEELYKDWEVTGFWNKSSKFNHKLRFQHLVNGFDSFPGDTIHARVENYVLSLGFTAEDIAKFRNLMLEQ